jgi:hypothetical protein
LKTLDHLSKTNTIKTMISEPNSNVKTKLISKFSQFKSKEKMIDYYVDF